MHLHSFCKIYFQKLVNIIEKVRFFPFPIVLTVSSDVTELVPIDTPLRLSLCPFVWHPFCLRVPLDVLPLTTTSSDAFSSSEGGGDGTWKHRSGNSFGVMSFEAVLMDNGGGRGSSEVRSATASLSRLAIEFRKSRTPWSILSIWVSMVLSSFLSRFRGVTTFRRWK